MTGTKLLMPNIDIFIYLLQNHIHPFDYHTIRLTSRSHYEIIKTHFYSLINNHPLLSHSNWQSLSYIPRLSLNIIEKYGKKLNWGALIYRQKVPEWIIYKYEHVLDERKLWWMVGWSTAFNVRDDWSEEFKDFVRAKMAQGDQKRMIEL
ncbi:hypothetical protein BKA69DRAFT_1041539 [Paraphysoderma sedebokerense]|nr:hypothetical protein BKA69DRAFT_1041539 [Paraphysoderma sedebokerense]